MTLLILPWFPLLSPHCFRLLHFFILLLEPLIWFIFPLLIPPFHFFLSRSSSWSIPFCSCSILYNHILILLNLISLFLPSSSSFSSSHFHFPSPALPPPVQSHMYWVSHLHHHFLISNPPPPTPPRRRLLLRLL